MGAPYCLGYRPGFPAMSGSDHGAFAPKWSRRFSTAKLGFLRDGRLRSIDLNYDCTALSDRANDSGIHKSTSSSTVVEHPRGRTEKDFSMETVAWNSTTSCRVYDDAVETRSMILCLHVFSRIELDCKDNFKFAQSQPLRTTTVQRSVPGLDGRIVSRRGGKQTQQFVPRNRLTFEKFPRDSPNEETTPVLKRDDLDMTFGSVDP